MKKEFLNKNTRFSYYQNRECKFCKAPIPDQEHGTREFCPITYDQDRNVRDCKTSFHRKKDKPERDTYSALIMKHKAITTRIDFLIKKTGYSVTTKDLDNYEILLTEALNYSISKDGILTSFYLKHSIISNPISNIHKILYND
ncbi:hypothetical protein [Ferruginibacter albus]|uniref:hypothetical protein n=1 Tax=Ferruginibacter albus TaxID=2875540 RepID=UPI001CC442F4|nr:hypothetical protein [Ferruginibacter albus]UAY52830.1 hypothetical protein K9M53_03915 [Ferruginibacter albus]UAY53101.1 hypothetical protein K9M53_05335 [Ferruginibacter albus]